jgi:hypothetical protein
MIVLLRKKKIVSLVTKWCNICCASLKSGKKGVDEDCNDDEFIAAPKKKQIFFSAFAFLV